MLGILTRNFAAVDVQLSSLWLPTGIRQLALMRSFLNQLQIRGLQKAGGSSEGFTSLTVKYLFCVCGGNRESKEMKRWELSKLAVSVDMSVALMMISRSL